MKRNTESRGWSTGRQAGSWLRSTLTALTLVLFGALVVPANAQDTATPAANRLEAIDFQALGGQQMQFRLRTSGPAPQPLAFTIDKPARISLDLPGVSLALPSRRIDVKAGGIDSLVAGEAGGRTRVVLNLDALVPYETSVDGNSIVLTVGAAASSGGVAASAPAAAVAGNSTGSAATGRRLENIDFRRGLEGSGRVIVRLSDSHTPVNVRQEGGQIVVDFIGAELPDALARRYDVTDFATPVTYIDALRAEGKARVVIAAGADFEHLAYQSDDQYVVEVKPPTKAKVAADERKEYTGERLTLNFQDIEVRAVLQLLADTSGQNIVVSDSVNGNVTLRLQNVPWDQALDIVMRAKGLDMRKQDNVILVGPAEELAAREKADLQARKEVQELAPLRGEYLQVNYAKAIDLAALIKSGSSGNGNSLLSARGSVAVDERTNTLLLQDTPDRLADIRRMVSTLDIPVRQVLIESRIVIVNDDFSRDLGVRLGANYFEARGPADSGLFTVGGAASAANTAIASAIDNLAAGGTVRPVAVPTGNSNFTDRYNVNLPVSNPAGRVSLALLDFPWLLDLELSAAQAEGRGEIQSSPRVITANQREASIEQGVEIPYQESSSSGATSTQFKKAVLSLRVKPQITPDNRIILDLTVSKDSVGQLVASATGGNVPSIDTRVINTQVLVNDGQTVVLGGIMETEQRESERKVPFLGDVPAVGRLFKTTTRVNNKKELLIFVTPKILREGASLY